ncbi:polysaccharide deacetylase family protein [Thermincola potens]|uniref:Polysaccharide deacetylase n=1 Tax=Thermincola potens (strain JR) TaxID=635013 RepID=D5XA54_THEPJ|nr:polysaccharide deacetylase family protein [Thermincola potens]ADG83187.1 polysaccharide deacetylase [Thermincola potens JR]
MRKFSHLLILLVLIFAFITFLAGRAEAPALKLTDNQRPIPVLMYHKVNPYRSSGGKGLRVDPNEFSWQMRYLKQRGFTTISSTDLINYLRHKKTLPKRPILITFDDGYEDNYLFAYPVMKRYGFKGVIFLVADDIGRYNVWDVKIGKQPYNKLLNWNQIMEMKRYGFEFGSHTLSHPHLARINRTVAAYEIAESKRALEKRLGVPVTSFAYPYGNLDDDVAQMVKKAGYSCAFTTAIGPVIKTSDPYRLNRFRITGYTNRTGFITAVEGEPY